MIYIQSNKEKTIPHHFDAACAMYGAIESGKDYKLVTYEEVISGKFDLLIRKNLFVGSVEFMKAVFLRIGLVYEGLPYNSNRDHKIITLGQAQQLVSEGEKLFIKPVEIKLFGGLVLDGMTYSSLNGIPTDTLVYAYKPFKDKILSEWRVYIKNHKIEDSRNYSGDFTISPDYEFVRSIIEENREFFPSAYVIDIGIFNHPNSNWPFYEVIEFNDMWAIGNYGVPNDVYLSMLVTRYMELIEEANKSISY